MIARPKNTKIYEHDITTVDVQTGEILSASTETKSITTTEPDYIKLYYETMLAFNRIDGIPVAFVASLSKYITWSNTDTNGKPTPMTVTLNKFAKDNMLNDVGVSTAQLDRYIRISVEKGLLFKTDYKSVYEVNPFMVARGKWDSIKTLRAQFDFTDGKWQRIMGFNDNDGTN